MGLPVTSIRFVVRSTDSSAVFYEALLGVSPSRREDSAVLFDVASPALALTLEPGGPSRPAAPPAIKTRAAHSSRGPGTPAERRFTLYVNDPQHVGELAVALRRAGAPILLADRGLSVSDPDGNRWSVVLSPTGRPRPIEQEAARAERPR